MRSNEPILEDSLDGKNVFEDTKNILGIGTKRRTNPLEDFRNDETVRMDKDRIDYISKL